MTSAGPSRRAFLKQALAAGAAGLAAACSSGDESNDRSAAPAASNQPPASATAPAIRRGLTGTITVTYPDELGKKPRYVEQAVAQVQQANPGATVRIDHQRTSEGDFYAKVVQAMSTGDAPDVIHAGGVRIGELVDAGHIIPLDDYVKSWPDWQYYPPWVRAGVTYQGKTWAIPYGLDTRFLYFRRDLFTQAGLPVDWQPKNLAGVLSAAVALRGKLPPGSIPYALYAGQAGDAGSANHGFVPLVWAYGGELQDQKGRWVGDSPAIRKALAFYAQAFQGERLVPQEILTTPRPWTVMRERLGAGSLALLFEGGWVYGGWAAKDRDGTARNVGYLLHPTETEGPSFTIGGSGTCWYITAASAHKDLAWEFIATWNNRDTVAHLNIEDPHPVARIDSVRVPEYRNEPFLVYSTNSLEKARFIAPDADFGKVVGAIQRSTGRVATGEAAPDDAARRYTEDLAQALGPDKVVTQI